MSSAKKTTKTPPKIEKPLTPEEELVKLEEAKNNVKKESFYMKRCLDNGKLMDALKHASSMISELRTSVLSPKNYYDLYMVCFDQLRHLEAFLAEEKQKGKKMSELYEVVQYAGNIVPRSYLLVTVGSVYIKTKEAPAKDVLRDLVEMCRGVQHPTRGLFLRNYLSEMTKDKLPDVGSEYEGEGGDVRDSIHFILQNFTEMNKLWVRMQRQGPVRNKGKREEERKELRLLVGKNLARLSQLDGVDATLYKESVLPKVLDQIIMCDDQIAQQYLMEIIIQVFPDMFHLQTLDLLLPAIAKLQTTVDPKPIFISLITRLANFLTTESSPEQFQIFKIFETHVLEVIEARSKMGANDVLSLMVILLKNLVLTVYPSKTEYVEKILKSCYEKLISMKESGSNLEEKETVKELCNLIRLPLEHYNNAVLVIKLNGFSDLVDLLRFATRKRIAIDVAKNVLKNETIIPTAEDVLKLFVVIKPLLQDSEGETNDEEDEDFAIEQNLVGAIVHLFKNENPEQLYLTYATARKEFGAGGAKRIKHTLPPLIFRSLNLAPVLKKLASDEDQWEKVGRKIFKFVHETVTALVRTDHKELAMRLFLQCARSASNCGFETIAYEFLTQVFDIYESDIVDSNSQFRAYTEIVGTLQGLKVFGDENFDTLITKTYVHSNKLLKKPDQCRASYMCAHLFWASVVGAEGGKEGERGVEGAKKVLACLQRSLRIADGCMDSQLNVKLFVEILNEYLYFFEHKNEAVAVKYLTGLIALIKTHLANMEVGDDNPEGAEVVEKYYANTIQHIQTKQAGDNDYSQIEL